MTPPPGWFANRPRPRLFTIAAALLLAFVTFMGTCGQASSADPPAPTTGTPYAGPCQPAESQSWWQGSNTGQHIHVAACIPTGIVDGTLTLAVKVTQHNGTGAIRWIRACRESSNCQRWSLTLGPCADCSTTVYLPIKVGLWPTGRQELRLTANVTTNADGKRQFQSTGWPVNVRSSSPCPRCSVFWEARGWYQDHDYANARLVSAPSALGSGAVIRVRLGPGSGGDPTRFAGVYIDPDFHHGNPGIVVREWSGPFTGSVTLPTLAAGTHKLVLVSSDGENAGVLAVPFEVR